MPKIEDAIQSDMKMLQKREQMMHHSPFWKRYCHNNGHENNFLYVGVVRVDNAGVDFLCTLDPEFSHGVAVVQVVPVPVIDLFLHVSFYQRAPIVVSRHNYSRPHSLF